MKTSAALVALVALLGTACAPAVYSQNLGPAHKVKRSMTPAEAHALMGAPAEAVSFSGVEEWRYCETRYNADVFVVLYFHEGRVIEKATYTLNPFIQWGDGAPATRVGDSCRDNLQKIYSDGQSPPRRVRELRRQGNR